MTSQTCDWAKCNTQGRNEADTLIATIRRDGHPLGLLRRFDPSATGDAVQVGFINRIAEHLATG